MIVRKLSDAKQQGRTVTTEGWTSHRLILKDDAVGFSFHITIIPRNSILEMHYKNHFESVYCISGRGEITDLDKHEKHFIEPGTMYLLNNHDRHRLIAFEDLQLACVFNPPLRGDEVHDKSGAYPLLEELSA
jgi:L-ectoine synthase